MRTYLTISSLLAVALLGLVARPAHALSNSCSKDSDCVKGWSCQVSASTDCASPACPPGEKCDEPIDCVTEDFKSCQPGPCSADADCADGMVCYTHTETNCPPVACAPGEDCPTPRCDPKTETACVPRYLLPCTTASDCGAGFRCEASGEQCTCSGSSGSGSGSGNGGGDEPGANDTPVPAPEAPDCTCEPSKELRCQATPVDCTADKDCSNGWTCEVTHSSSDCATPAPDPGQAGAAPAPECTPSEPTKACMPPYYSLVGNVAGVDRDSSGAPTLGGSDNGAEAPNAESGTDGVSSSGGCSVAHGGRSGSTLALLGALGLFGILRRRRAH